MLHDGKAVYALVQFAETVVIGLRPLLVKLLFCLTQHALFPPSDDFPRLPHSFKNVCLSAVKKRVCVVLGFLYQPVDRGLEVWSTVHQSSSPCTRHLIKSSVVCFSGRQYIAVSGWVQLSAPCERALQSKPTLTGQMMLLPKPRFATCLARAVNLASIGSRFTLVS